MVKMPKKRPPSMLRVERAAAGASAGVCEMMLAASVVTCSGAALERESLAKGAAFPAIIHVGGYMGFR